ncbi:carbohydrate ABC transporter permease [Paenibacillus sp. GCM10027629]|uniref:carbohydrate ABC transporter permease n=1 Tax=Paenibacillus sp. GCM10027629 TaxID=3273414 RepID=UPI00362D94AC
MRERFFLGFVYVLLTVFALICFIPFWIVLINSFANETVIQTSGYQLFPTSFSLDAYAMLLSGNQVFRSYGVTLFVTTTGTVLGVLLTASFAYVLSHPKVKYRHVLSFLTFFTMLFGAGLVGFYMLIANWLGLKDSLWALILPYLLNPFYAFILVSYYRSLPYELNEAATVDGANDIHIFFRVIWPISLPVIATVALFYALQYWNDWYLSLLFIDNYKLHPLQMMIRQLMSNLNAMSYVGGSQTDYNIMIPTYGMQLAIVCITIGPIVFVYPFVQKYFIKGMTLGSVKG